MRSCFALIAFVSIYVGNCYSNFLVYPGPKIKATIGQVWPKPQQQRTTQEFLVVKQKTFSFQAIGEDCYLLQRAFKRYSHIVANTDPSQKDVAKSDNIWDDAWMDKTNFLSFLEKLDVNVKEPCDNNSLPSFHMNEEYTLNINSPKPNYSILTATTVWGALRGLETFSQMLYPPEDNASPGLLLNVTEIVDYPRFAHRGLLIDTSRHFLPKKTILKILDGMAYSKMNVLHWHIVDDQSFPFQSQVYPELSGKGAFEKTLIYTPQDVQDILYYSTLRGIRVLPEFDTPGHTRSWGVGFPEILTPCYKDGRPSGEYGPLDPTKNATYTFVRNLFAEVKSVFPDGYIHLGGDEVELGCWQSNPNIQNFMKTNNLQNVKKVEEYYIQRAINITNDLKIKSVVWEEVFTDGAEMPKDTVVHVWKGNTGNHVMNLATKAGYPTLLSACWYLDHLATGGDWQKFYKCDPYDFHPDAVQKKLILGGEACMWGETANVYNVLQKIWPRASAAAEKLWSAQNAASINDASRRLEEHACRMNIRGIPAQPPNGPGVCIPALKHGLYS